MATIINTPQRSEDSGLGMVIGIIFALLLIGLFFFYAVPAIRTNMSSTQGQTPNNTLDVNLTVPSQSTTPNGATPLNTNPTP